MPSRLKHQEKSLKLNNFFINASLLETALGVRYQKLNETSISQSQGLSSTEEEAVAEDSTPPLLNNIQTGRLSNNLSAK